MTTTTPVTTTVIVNDSSSSSDAIAAATVGDDDVSLLLLPSFDSCIVTDAPEQQQQQQQRKRKRKRTSNDDDDHRNRHSFPFVLSPPTDVANGVTMIDTSEKLTKFIQLNSNRIDTILNEQCGAILFRGFPSLTKENATAHNFNTFVESFDCMDFQDLSYDKSMSFAVRTKITNRICTTNEGKSGGLVFHHEQAQTPLWPSHVFFCCELPAAKNDGGETGIVSSIKVYEELKELYPTFINKLEKLGIQYTIYSGLNSDSTKGSGRSWKSFFHVTNKKECEIKMNAGGWTYEWGVGPSGTVVDENFLKCTTPILEGVKTMKNGQKCFFNQLIATTANALEFSKVGSNSNRNDSSGISSNSNDNDIDNGYNPLIDIPTQDGINECVKFSNGDQIDLDILLKAKDICEEYSIDIQWEKGDICLLSNYLCMHARRIWSGPIGTRKLLASLVQETNCTSFNHKLIV